MKRHLRMTRRTRLRLALLAILALLCQQVAFAAYLCPAIAMPAMDMAMSADCNAMPETAPTQDTRATTTQCVLHCAQQAAVTNNVQSPSVPPLLMPAMLPAPLSVAPLSAARTAHARDAMERTPALPPPLRYRVLLI
jgi:hypothetical protein